MTGRLGIDDVTPKVGDGHHPGKAVVGEVVPIGASVWREGHDAIAANVVWKKVGSDGPGQHIRMAPQSDDVDRFAATVVPDEPGLWTFRVDAWSDPWATWRHAVTVKLKAGQSPDELANDLEVGARLLQRVGRRPAERANRDLLFAAANALRDTALPLQDRVAPALFPAVQTIMVERPVRELITRGQPHQVYVDRTRALFGSWYEFFPRSTGGRDENGRPVHGTFATSTKELDRVAAMGFDVVYLPPIHPVGTVHRKGPNTAALPGGNPVAEPGDVGSPWAIGSAEGGHDAIDPALGDFDDFDAFVARAKDLGMEIALDFALQCAPGPPVGGRASRVVHRAPRRDDRLRREPAQEVPGHLPGQLRQRPRGHLRRVAARRAALGRARRADLPGRQPAHQAAELLALADLAGQGQAPGRAVPRRGVHPPGTAVRPGPAGLHAVATPTSPGARARRS